MKLNFQYEIFGTKKSNFFPKTHTHFEKYANSKNVFKISLDLPIQSLGDFKYLHFFDFCWTLNSAPEAF